MTEEGIMADHRELSEGALVVLRLRLEGHRVEVSAETRDAYHELAKAGLMDPVHTFAKGRDSHYRLTLAAVERSEDWLNAPTPSILALSPGESAASRP
jgi:hypothetical protein